MADMSEPTIVTFPRKLLKQFILMYKDFECLWKRDNPAYKIKMKRHHAITQLTQLVQSYDPAATRVHILRKIDSLRACVRREFKKVTESRRKATCEEEVHKPQLWYYDIFSFLLNEELEQVKVEQRSLEQNTESSEEEVESEDPNSDDFKTEPFETVVDYDPPTPKSGKQETVIFNRSPRRKRSCTRASEGPSTVDDEYDAIGINVAAKLRHLPYNMRILAEKLIGDVLFQAQTNGLTAATVVMTPDPFH